MRRSVLLFLPVLGCLLAADRNTAEDEHKDARAVGYMTAAKVSLSFIAKSDKADVPADRDHLVKLLRADLKAHESPAVAQARAQLEKEFDPYFARILKKAGEKLEPEGMLKLAEYASKRQPGQRESVKESIARRYKGHLAGTEFESAYDKARDDIVSEQMRKARRIIREDEGQARFHPSSAWIDRGLKVGHGRDWAADLLRLLRPEAGGVILSEAKAQITLIAEKQVEAGAKQVKAQWAAMETPSAALTVPGKEKDYLSRLEKKARSIVLAPGEKRYGVFPSAQKEAQERAIREFDAAIITAASPALLSEREVTVGSVLGREIRKLIETGLDRHHLPDESQRELEPIILKTVLKAKERVSGPIVERAREKPSPFDAPEDLRRLTVSIDERLESKGCPAHKAWMGLSAGVRKQVEGLILGVRLEIAGEQARRYNPDLIEGKWIPSEGVLLACAPGDLTRERLCGLAIWGGRPPRKEDILVEGWTSFLSSARTALERGRTAHARQLALAQALEPALMKRVQADPQRGAAHWVKEGVRMLLASWQEEPGAARYPGLFTAPQRLIEAAVARALRLLAEVSAQRWKGALAWGAEQLKKGVVSDPAAFKKELEKKGAVEGGVRPSPEVAAQLENLTEEAMVLVRQNALVSAARSAIKGEIDDAIRGRADVTVKTWAGRYAEKVAEEWKPDKMSARWPDLLPAVLQRIAGIVPEMVGAAFAGLEQRVLAAQLAVVDALKPEVNEAVKTEIQAMKKRPEGQSAAGVDKFRKWLMSRGVADWRMSEAFRSWGSGYPDLLPVAGAVIDTIIRQNFPASGPGDKDGKGDGNGLGKSERKEDPPPPPTPIQQAGGNRGSPPGFPSIGVPLWLVLLVVLVFVFLFVSWLIHRNRAGIFRGERGGTGLRGWWREWMADRNDWGESLRCLRELGPDMPTRLRRVRLLEELVQRFRDQVEERLRSLRMPSSAPGPPPAPPLSTAVTTELPQECRWAPRSEDKVLEVRDG
jgi:hypothetical protein